MLNQKMKKMKCFIVCIIMGILLITLTGCTEENNNSNNASTTKGNTTNTTTNTTATNSNNTNNKNTTKKSSEKVDVEKYDFVSAGKAQIAEPQKGDTIAVLHIKNYGDIKVKFFKDVAPKAVENFITLSKKGYYNGVTFHRVINDFMIQGGDPTGTGRGGSSMWNKAFQDEFDLSVAPYRGALCMANSGTNTNGSQFFIEQAKYNETTYKLLEQNGYPKNLLEAYKTYGGSMHLFYVHTVFGQVIEGMDVVDNIAKCKTDSNDKPTEAVVIESIEILEY